ncbi:tripartite tricarboxylate transporter TctB family protein [Pelagibius sp. Alg239-R121]|uniref:tripartite tricarboxylate transporter TctB family protein n=1 Tax=Pelagibius sp. Alg239-R121 TaxID=2993448 RepID=UPI0024A670BB|nr:tripartite tricarboxylate transporter TctB family protein [Pelagibius sp. Alg239-R121]
MSVMGRAPDLSRSEESSVPDGLAAEPVEQGHRRPRAPLMPGVVLASGVFFAIGLLLLSQVGVETKWFKRVPVVLQPAFWPTVSLAVMSFFSGAVFITNLIVWRRAELRAPLLPGDGVAGLLRPFEFVFWFLAYATSVPYLGYLISTVIFMPLLGIRVGCRKASTLILLALVGLATVLLFKTGFSVKMPAGALYDLAPDVLRNFLIRNF